MVVLDLVLNALATGVMLGSIYALLALGLAITFGILHIPNVAHPALVIAGAYAVVTSNRFGLDPILAGVLWAVPFYLDRKSTRLNSSHVKISYAVFCLKKKTSSN